MNVTNCVDLKGNTWGVFSWFVGFMCLEYLCFRSNLGHRILVVSGDSSWGKEEMPPDVQLHRIRVRD